jgi:hypothetical protein
MFIFFGSVISITFKNKSVLCEICLLFGLTKIIQQWYLHRQNIVETIPD